MKFGLFLSIVLVCVSNYAANAETEYKTECIVDSSKEPSEKDNYVDCTSEEYVADGTTDCCEIDSTITCCDKSASWWKFIWICIGIGSATIVLAILCFWIYWCDDQMCPRFAPYRRKWDEKTDKCKRTVCCCCVDNEEDDDDFPKKKAVHGGVEAGRRKSGGLPDQEVRPESSISSYSRDNVVSPSNIHNEVVEVQPGPETDEMPPEYQTKVKDDFLNF